MKFWVKSVGAGAIALAGTFALATCIGPAREPTVSPPVARPAAEHTPQTRAIAAGYRRVLLDMATNYWDPNTSPNPIDRPRIRPTHGNGGPDTGLPADDAARPTVWQMAQYAKLLSGEWRIDQSTSARQRLIEQWAAMQAVYRPGELAGDGRRDGSIVVSTDAGWKANYLAQLHEATGDRRALADLLEMIPAVLNRFNDPRQRRILLGESPRGLPIRANPYGMLLADGGDPASPPVSSLSEAMFANAALYAFEQSGTAAYRRYAEMTWRWIHDNLRNVKEHPADAATGIYLAELLLDPATFVNRRPMARNRYLGRPIRGVSAEYGGGTIAMAVLSARLYRLTRDPLYLAEARRITAAYVHPDAFMRVRDGRPVFVNTRDPWTSGYWLPDFVAEVLPLPGVDAEGRFREALRNTAEAILRQRTPDGYYGADWSGPELNIATGATSWAEDSVRANGGRGGGPATPRQIMTSASAALVVQAAYALDR